MAEAAGWIRLSLFGFTAFCIFSNSLRINFWWQGYYLVLKDEDVGQELLSKAFVVWSPLWCSVKGLSKDGFLRGFQNISADKADALALERFQKRPSGPSSSVFNSLEYSSEENTIYQLGAIKVPSWSPCRYISPHFLRWPQFWARKDIRGAGQLFLTQCYFVFHTFHFVFCRPIILYPLLFSISYFAGLHFFTCCYFVFRVSYFVFCRTMILYPLHFLFQILQAFTSSLAVCSYFVFLFSYFAGANNSLPVAISPHEVISNLPPTPLEIRQLTFGTTPLPLFGGP